jgi:hypothetical protein
MKDFEEKRKERHEIIERSCKRREERSRRCMRWMEGKDAKGVGGAR